MGAGGPARPHKRRRTAAAKDSGEADSDDLHPPCGALLLPQVGAVADLLRPQIEAAECRLAA